MQSGISLFKSKVAKRFFFLFLLCAMLPITLLSLLSYFQVSIQLREQSMTRLQSEAKAYGLILFEKLSFLKSEIDLFEPKILLPMEEESGLKPNRPYFEGLQRHFNAISFINNSGTIFHLAGITGRVPDNLIKVATNNITPGTMIFFEPPGETIGRVFLAKTTFSKGNNPGLLVGEVNSIYLWGVGHENSLPPMTEICVLDHARNVLFSSFQLPEPVLHRIRFENDSLQTRSLKYTSDGESFFIGYWPLFLKSKFEGPNLIVILRNIRDAVFAPLSNFKMLFSLVSLLAFWIVLFLSTISIRKSMIPLEKLKEGALRVACRDFDTRITVNSGDEFEVLAETFNKSAAALGRQFHAMETMSEIDRAILSSLSINHIIDTAIKRMYAFFSCDAVSLGLIQPKQPNVMHSFNYCVHKLDRVFEEFLTVGTEDLQRISNQSDVFMLNVKNPPSSFLPRDILQEIKYFLVLPLYLDNKFTGIICLGHKEAHSYSDDDLSDAKRLSNQVEVALSNAHLVEKLELLNSGTLEALARTVDAKSKWTAGHSERVKDLSMKIARVMGCDQKMIDTLRRAAFLHDIGKIGIPLSILDKPGKLTEEEYNRIKEHPVIGAKILEPIDAYADVIPIILQHHERFDGNGYPYGLSGKELTLGARILSVADVYDALVSNRPYRQGWVEEKGIRLIIDESGKQFDPKVVDAFLTAVSSSVGNIWSEEKLPSVRSIIRSRFV